MNYQRNIPHHFKLAGTKVGDTFQGCPKCWFRTDPGTVAVPICRECGGRLLIYDVTVADIPRGAKAR